MNILITGCNGFLGRHFSKAMEPYAANHDIYFANDSSQLDLRNFTAVKEAFDFVKPDVVIHLAANVGGIHHNVTSPFSVWVDNTMMNTNIIAACVTNRVSRLIHAGSVCMYPDHMDRHFFSEDMLDDGPPNNTNYSYGYSKRGALAGCMAAHMEMGLQFDFPIFTNLYGQGEPTGERAHTVGAFMKRFDECMPDKPFTIWGTGAPKRDLLHVTDAVRSLLAILKADPANRGVNIATGDATQILHLAQIIGESKGWKGKFEFDSNRPDGQMVRAFTTDLAKRYYDWRSEITIEDGIAHYEDSSFYF